MAPSGVDGRLHAGMGGSGFRRKRGLLLALPVLLGAGLLLTLIIKHSSDTSPFGTEDGQNLKPPPGASERARAHREFRERHATELDARTDQSLQADPSYGKSLLKVDEKFVRSLKGFSDEEKVELLRTVQAAQDRARKAGNRTDESSEK